MKIVTKSVTTYFFTSLCYLIQILMAVFSPLYIVEGDIYVAYCHQNTIKSLISLLIKPVFIVVTEVVTIFQEGWECVETTITALDAGRIDTIYCHLARAP